MGHGAMNQKTDIGDRIWFVVISLIATRNTLYVFVTGKNLPDHWAKPTPSLETVATWIEPTAKIITPTMILPSISFQTAAVGTLTPTVIPTPEGLAYIGEPWFFQDITSRPIVEGLENLENIWDQIDKREQILYVPSSKTIPVVVNATK